jgi:hypothetical protein
VPEQSTKEGIQVVELIFHSYTRDYMEVNSQLHNVADFKTVAFSRYKSLGGPNNPSEQDGEKTVSRPLP